MSNARQFVAVKFPSGSRRLYTYHNDGEPVSPGDQVKVADRSGDGWSRVEVVEITDTAPPFATKPILGKIEPEEPAEPNKASSDLFGNGS